MPLQRLALQVSTAITVPACVCNSALVYAILRNPKLRAPNNFFYIHMALIDALLCFYLVIINTIQFIYPDLLENHYLCQMDAMVIQICSGMSVVNWIMLGIYHYRVVFLEKDAWTMHQILVLFLYLWAQAILLSTVPLWSSDSGYRIHSSGVWCGVRTDATSVLDRVTLYIAISCMIVASVLLISVFYVTLSHISKSISNQRPQGSSEVQLTPAGTWIDAMLKQKEVDPVVDFVTVALVRLNMLVNPFVMVLTDRRFARAVLSLFVMVPMSIRSRKTSEQDTQIIKRQESYYQSGGG
ncbi:hypothetical protein EDD86DRAFT_248960 [Gorgonomyces haynaldii]|nr:hypothetical protein EDD86DRAFT_248960 [Gorgonomyces haynaldii]